jgi:hypothetical protein
MWPRSFGVPPILNSFDCIIKLSGRCLRIQVAQDLLGEFCAKTRRGSQLLSRGAAQAGDRTKVFEKALNAFWAKAGYFGELAGNRGTAPLPLKRNRKAVGFISHALNEK